jgi:hypothetical protein
MEPCLNCKKPVPKKSFLGLKVVFNGKEIGAVCNDCLLGTNSLRLLLVRDKNDEPFKLREYMPLPKSNR